MITDRITREKLDDAPRSRLWTRGECHRAYELGLISADERVELLDGDIIAYMGPQKSPHVATIRRIAEAFRALFGSEYEVRSQGPLVLSDYSEPEPDILVVRGSFEDFADRHPIALQVVLLLEVSDTTLRQDRLRKASISARGDISEYWIVNLQDNCLEVHRQPKPKSGYKDISVLKPGDSVSPIALAGAVVFVSSLLPPATS